MNYLNLLNLSWVWHVAVIPLALLYANMFEWFAHKYLLHGLGRSSTSFWSFHWGVHHRNAKKNGFLDPDYRESPWKWNAQGKELLALLMGALIHLPILPFFHFFYLALLYCGFRYYYVHRKSHCDVTWAKKHLPWHYDHHMGSNQNLNWCVTKPWFDYLMGTRREYFNRS